MENKELYQYFLKTGEEILFESSHYGFAIKKGKILNNYKNGELRVEFNNGSEEEIIAVEQILFITKCID